MVKTILLLALAVRVFGEPDVGPSVHTQPNLVAIQTRETAHGKCAEVLKCLSQFPVKREGEKDPLKPPTLIPGIPIDPTRTAGPGDPNCPSGHCIIVDPTELCDGSLPHCLPISNIKSPYLPCDKNNPKCPPFGILLDPNISCHILDAQCPPGGVIVPSIPCNKGEENCPNGSRLPPWITPTEDNPTVADRPKWPPTHEEPEHPLHTDTPLPGIEFDPTKLCSAMTAACHDPEHGVVVDLESKCDARKPGCISVDNLHDPILTNDDPLCKPGTKRCAIVNMRPCHPNDSNAPPGCIKTDPIPCVIGSEGCHSGVKLPDPVQKCVPKSLGCSDDGHIIVPPPLVHHTEPPIPTGTPALVIDPNGPFLCAMVAVKPIPPKPEVPVKPVTTETLIVRESIHVTVTSTTTSVPVAQIKTDYKTVTFTTTSLLAAQTITQTSTQISATTFTSTTTSILEAKTITQTLTTTTCLATEPVKPTEASKPIEAAKPTTKFPCSPDEANPCKSTLITGWTPFFLQWYQTPHWGPPNPFTTSINYDVETLLELTDDRLKMERFDVSLDGVLIGKTSVISQNYNQQCGTSAEACIAQGYSHGYFNIPKGSHTLTISWTEGTFGPPNGGAGAGQYRFHKACDC